MHSYMSKEASMGRRGCGRLYSDDDDVGISREMAMGRRVGAVGAAQRCRRASKTQMCLVSLGLTTRGHLATSSPLTRRMPPPTRGASRKEARGGIDYGARVICLCWRQAGGEKHSTRGVDRATTSTHPAFSCGATEAGVQIRGN
jgi:hypothetical protein